MHNFLATKPSRPLAIVEGMLATLIWSSSFVIIKTGVDQIGPLTLAGLRYSLSAALLLFFLLMVNRRYLLIPWRLTFRLFIIGITAYTIANGAWYVSLNYLSAITLTLLSGLSPLIILGLGILWFKEVPSTLQIVGLIISLVGGILFLLPDGTSGKWIGLILAMIGVISYAYSSLVGREIAKIQQVNTLVLTAVPLAFGGILLLLVAPIFEELPHLSWAIGRILGLLILVNTILAYLLYNHALQTITAFEINTLLNLSPIGTAVLAWVLLGETLSQTQVLGMMIVIGGVMLVQKRNVSTVEISQ